MVPKLLMWSWSFPLHSLIQDTYPVSPVTCFCSTTSLKCYFLFAWVCVKVKLKLSICIPWRHIEECGSSDTSSLFLIQERGEQWVSCPRCFTQGKTAARTQWIGSRMGLLENWKYLAHTKNWTTILWLDAHKFLLLKHNLKSYWFTPTLPHTSLVFIILIVNLLKLYWVNQMAQSQ